MNSIEDRNLFKSAVTIALEEWDALQAAIDHGMGGEYSEEKAEWMIEVIRKYFVDNKNSFDFDEAICYVEEIMDREFDTLIEDGSTEILIRKIMKFFSLSNQEKYDELRNELEQRQEKLVATQDARTKRRQEIKLQEDLEEMNISSDQSEDEETKTNEENNRAKTDEDGWTKF